MKVCFLLPAHWSGTLGGAEIQVKYLIDVLRNRGGSELHYICRHAEQANDVRVHTLRHSSIAAKYAHSVDFFQVRALLRQIRPDVIYTRTDSAYVGMAARYCARTNCRLIWHVAHQRDVEPFRLSGLRALPRLLDRKLFEYGVRRADVIIGQARYQEDLLRTNFARSCNDIVPNFHPEAPLIDKPPGPITVVWIANIKSAKRPEAFIELAAALRGRPDLRFLMIGDVQDRQWETRLPQAIEGLENLTYLGRLPLDEANAVLASSHIFVNTSVAEGFPNTFIQAWLRKAVVVSLSVDPDDVLRGRGHGYLSGSAEQLAADVLRLATDPAEREDVAERSYRYARETYSLRNAERLLRHFE